MKRGDRVVHGDKELVEKLGRNDQCPCGSGLRFQAMLPPFRTARRSAAFRLLFASEGGASALARQRLDASLISEFLITAYEKHWHVG